MKQNYEEIENTMLSFFFSGMSISKPFSPSSFSLQSVNAIGMFSSAVQLVFFLIPLLSSFFPRFFMQCKFIIFHVISFSICKFTYLSEIKSVVILSWQDNFIVCMKCFKNGNYGEKRSMEDFKLNESSEISVNHSAVWTEGETLLLLESVLKHGDDWELVAQSVRTKTKLECISKLIELPFGELMLGSACRNDNSNSVTGIVNNGNQVQASSSDHQETSMAQDQSFEPKNEIEQNGDAVNENPSKRRRVATLSDSSSSLMKQVRDIIEFYTFMLCSQFFIFGCILLFHVDFILHTYI